MLADVEARKSADPRRGNRHLIESDFNQILNLSGPQGTTTFHYDSNGNQTQKVEDAGTTTYTWDARDRLTQVNLPGGGVSRFGYDPRDLRVFMQDAQGSRRVLLDGRDEIGEYDAQSVARITRYDRDPMGIDLLFAQVRGQQKLFAVTDDLASIYSLTDSTGEHARYSYDAYGERSTSSEETVTPWTFTGRRLDDLTQLLYYRSRYRDQKFGDWLQRDELMVGTNLYSYVNDNPTRYRDPDGFYARDTVTATIIKAAIALAATVAVGVVSRDRGREHDLRELLKLLARILDSEGVDVTPVPPQTCPPDGKCFFERVIKIYYLDWQGNEVPAGGTGPRDLAPEKWLTCEYKCNKDGAMFIRELDFPDHCPEVVDDPY